MLESIFGPLILGRSHIYICIYIHIYTYVIMHVYRVCISDTVLQRTSPWLDV